MYFCPIKTVFCAEDVNRLLSLSASETAQLHKIKVLQFNGRVDTIAGCIFTLPNAFDLLVAHLYLVLTRNMKTQLYAKKLSDSTVDLFANILDTITNMDFCKLDSPIFRRLYASRIYEEISTDFAVIDELLEATFHFWKQINQYVKFKSKIRMTEINLFFKFSNMVIL